jgi:hypothetical protein
VADSKFDVKAEADRWYDEHLILLDYGLRRVGLIATLESLLTRAREAALEEAARAVTIACLRCDSGKDAHEWRRGCDHCEPSHDAILALIEPKPGKEA